MNTRLSDIRSIAVDAAAIGRRSLWPLIGAFVLAQLVVGAIVAPFFALVVNWLVRTSGQHAVANEELVRFFLSLRGFAVIAVVAMGAVAASIFTRAVLLRVAWKSVSARRPSPALGLGAIVRRLPRLFELSARVVAKLALVLAPFAAVVGVIAWFVVRDVDLYWLVTTRPRRFWIGALLAAPVALAGVAIAAHRLFAWSIALPLSVLDDREAGAAIAESRRRLANNLGMAALVRIGWFVAMAIVAAVGFWLLKAIFVTLLAREFGGLHVTAVAAAAALVIHGAFASATTFAATAGDALLILALERRFGGLPIALPERDPSERGLLTTRRVAWLGAGVVALLGWLAAGALLEKMHRPMHLEITAHRGAKNVAPENTIAAVLGAAELGADRIEIDVQLTRDGELVVFHDSDLRRMSNDPRRVRDSTLAELREFDVGAWFDPAFAGTTMPTLTEVLDALDASAQKTPLNVEIKVAVGGADAADEARAAAVATARLLAERGDPRHVVTSLSLPVLDTVRGIDASRPIGAILSASVGDLRQIDVDFYSVSLGLATPALFSRARDLDRDVHVWTVDNPDMLCQLALRGATGIITDDVAAMRARLEELQEITEVERLLLAFRTKMLE